ncbi:STAS domain-containing protein [Streptomyces sp. RKAG337]|uniref:STAS domain-containing protein n=1 Tax=Streptomyces sp. RKAG337 TaxID=2893404 RepID=UPI0020347AB8|nr:STAS domain-containing protein [Streptomyces sp. RKAG337]MCM2426989.1 STAS domain-containing protein [Streptomyces sp. RKAG337]
MPLIPPDHPSPAFAVHIRTGTRGTAPIVELHGEIDLMAAPYISRRLDGLARGEHGGGGGAVHPPDLVIDVTGVTFMDCRGLSALVRAHNLISARHGRLHLTGVRPHLRKLLHLTGLDRTFAVQDARVGRVSAPCR